MKIRHLFIVIILLITRVLNAQIGAVDSTFNVEDSTNHVKNFGWNSVLHSSKVLANGDVITVGQFDTFRGQSVNNIIKYNWSGELDQSFMSNIGSGPDTVIKHILILDNGNFFLTGEFHDFNGTACNGTIMLNSDGTIDNNYNAASNINITHTFNTELQGSMILLYGVNTNTTNNQFQFTRIDQLGNIDNTFIQPIPTGSGSTIKNFTLDQNNHIYIIGQFDTISGHATSSIARLLPDGFVDTTFYNQTGDTMYSVSSMDVDNNNKLLYYPSLSMLNNPYPYQIRRLNLDGTLDILFETFVNSNGSPQVMEATSDGFVYASSHGMLIRYDSLGNEDDSFGSYSLSNAPPTSYSQGLDILPSGKAVLTLSEHVLAVQANGLRDPSLLKISGASRQVLVVKALKNGKTLIGGAFDSYNDIPINGIARLHPNGQLDQSFSTGDLFVTGYFNSSNFLIRDIEVLNDGKILVAGLFSIPFPNPTYQKKLIRLLPNGELDTTFIPIHTWNSAFENIVLLDSGKFLINNSNSIVRYLPDGTIDPTFNIAYVGGAGGLPSIANIKTLPNGKILVGGNFDFFNMYNFNYNIGRLNADGTPDNTFTNSNTSSTNFMAVRDIEPLESGKILVSSFGYEYDGHSFKNIFRINPNGDFDTTFFQDSLINSVIYPSYGQIKETSDEKIWLFGKHIDTLNQINQEGLLRLLPSGEVDSTINYYPQFGGEIWSYDIQPDNKIIIGGNFNSYAGKPKFNIARIVGDTTYTNCDFFKINFTNVPELNCNGVSTVQANALNGLEPFSYSWDNQGWSINDTIHVFTTAGIHSLSVTDSLGCYASRDILINGPTSNTSHDAGVDVVANSFRPGFENLTSLSGYNIGCNCIAAGQIKIVHDSLISFNSATIMPDIISGDTLTWNYSNLCYDSLNFFSSMNFSVSALAQIGDSVNFHVNIEPIAGDFDSTNNTKHYKFPVVNGYDPNDKKVYPTGECFPNFIHNDEKLTYTVRFQNTGNSEAINIKIIDSLSQFLNINTVRVLSSSHAMHTEIEPGYILNFVFNNIHLPDSTSDEPGSQGFVCFEVEPFPFLFEGSVIVNKADIYFDFNPPITTNQTFQTISDNFDSQSSDTLEVTEQFNYFWGGNTYYSSGNYSHVFTNSFGCDSLGFLALTILNDTSNIQSIDNSLVKIYPNPSNTYFTVSGVHQCNLTIYNSMGEIEKKLFYQSGKKIDISNLSDGIYFVQLESQTSNYNRVLVVHN